MTGSHREYWRDRLAGPLGVVELAAGQDQDTVEVPVDHPVDTVTLLAAVQVLLSRYCGVTDVLLGLAVDHGNTVVLRGDLAGDLTTTDVLAATSRDLEAALAHQVPLDELMRAAGLTTLPFQAAVVVDPMAPRIDTALTVLAEPGRLSLRHDPALTAGLADDLATVLAGLTEDRPVRDLLPRPAPERRPAPDPAAMHVTGPGFVPFDRTDLDGSIIDRVLRQVDRHGDRPAVVTPDGTVTYRELAAQAAGIATALYEAGAGPGTRVVLLLDHGRDTIAAILGVLWTGAAHVPLDPAYPVERLARMLGHAEASVVVTTDIHSGLLGKLGTVPPVVDLGRVAPAEPPPSKATAGSPAYVLYTSGSTGLPKGVVQTHENVLFQVRNHTNNLRVVPDDRVSLLSSFSFDMAVTDLFSALLNGAAVVPLDLRGGALAGLAATIAELGVTVYHSTPTVYRHLLGGLTDGQTLGRVRAVLLGGEPVTGEDVERSRPHLRADAVLINGYGATEVSFAAQHHLPLASTGTPTGVVPIGHPLQGIEIVLLAPDGRPAALYGEIGIRSRYVSVGYWRDPELNARRFRVEADGTRTYLTGDLGRRLPDGTLTYLGRGDRQVKIRGYRVELGELEAALHTDPSVGQAVAVARGTELIAYVEGERADPAALRARLAERLPHFMVPRTIIAMAALPLTPTGKVDVRALPAPDVVRPRSAPPEGPVESAIAEAWCHVLGVPAVGRDDNFFEVGGTSLLLARVQERLGGQFRLTTMLEHSTVAALAGFVTDSGTTADAALGSVAERMSRRRQARNRRGGP